MELVVVTCVGVITAILLGLLVTTCRRFGSATHEETLVDSKSEIRQDGLGLGRSEFDESVRRRKSVQHSTMESPQHDVMGPDSSTDSVIVNHTKDDNSNICKSNMDMHEDICKSMLDNEKVICESNVDNDADSERLNSDDNEGNRVTSSGMEHSPDDNHNQCVDDLPDNLSLDTRDSAEDVRNSSYDVRESSGDARNSSDDTRDSSDDAQESSDDTRERSDGVLYNSNDIRDISNDAGDRLGDTLDNSDGIRDSHSETESTGQQDAPNDQQGGVSLDCNDDGVCIDVCSDFSPGDVGVESAQTNKVGDSIHSHQVTEQTGSLENGCQGSDQEIMIEEQHEVGSADGCEVMSGDICVSGEITECERITSETSGEIPCCEEKDEPLDKTDTYVEYEVEYTATLNLNDGCVENIGVVTDLKTERETLVGEISAQNQNSSGLGACVEDIGLVNDSAMKREAFAGEISTKDNNPSNIDNYLNDIGVLIDSEIGKGKISPVNHKPSDLDICLDNISLVTDSETKQEAIGGEISPVNHYQSDLERVDSPHKEETIKASPAVELLDSEHILNEDIHRRESEACDNCDNIDEMKVGFSDSDMTRDPECVTDSSHSCDVQIKADIEVADVESCKDHSSGDDNIANVVKVENSSDQIDAASHSERIGQPSRSHAGSDSDDIENLIPVESSKATSQTEACSELETSSWDSCFLCFKDKMATLGLHSASLDTFVTSSSITLRTICTNHKNVRLKRQNTDPGESNSERDRRAIKIVKMASFDSSDHSPPGDDVAMDTMIIKDSFSETEASQGDSPRKDSDKCDILDNTDNIVGEIENKQSEVVEISEAVSSDSNINNSNSTTTTVSPHIKPHSDEDATDSKTDKYACAKQGKPSTSHGRGSDDISAPDVATMAILRDMGRKLDFEHKQRIRAEDWAEFLTLELDAHIDARTSTEERHVTMRERMIRMAGKYRKLKSEHATLVTQIQDMTHDDTSTQKPPQKNRTSLLRRNKSVGDRQTIMAKRNAMLIRGSCRQGSSEESDSPGESPSDVPRSNGVPNSIRDIKRMWEANFKKKQEVSKPSTNDVSVSSANDSIDVSGLLSQSSDQDKFKREMATYDPYVTSTPIKAEQATPQLRALSQKQGSKTSRKVAFDKNKSQSTPDVRIESPEESTDVQVNVKAFTNMWEQKLQKLPFETMTSSGHNGADSTNPSNQETPPSSSPKRMRVRTVEDLKTRVEVAVEDKIDAAVSSDSDDDEFFDVECPSPVEEVRSETIVTESINTQQALHMWENLSASNTSSGSASEASKSVGQLSPPPVTVHAQQRPKFDRRSSQEDSSDASHDVPETISPLGRSNHFSSLKSKWEQKGAARQPKS